MRRINLFQRGVPIVDERGVPTIQFQTDWQQTVKELFASIDTVGAAQTAATAAQTAADNAQTAADAADAAASDAQAATDETRAETSLVNSYPANPVGTLITADNTGLVTIADHDRIYGDPTLNPTVPVVGDTNVSGGVSGDIIRVYYSDPSRAGGAVTYAFTIDPAAPPVQGGDIHSVGAVTIPAAGSNNGGPVRPPGYANPIP
ncbi:hypothetical protein [Sphingopyxis witflariensis]|uniref:hypothetical protein n=1 Tax=Sphingopyxis witflariensis TaxID=173675 RepID=UPI000B4DEF24|nr:hypothetical protein [Sphingopyxis witflariensis]